MTNNSSTYQLSTKIKNYYEVLELNRNANQESIANSYSRLSLKYHPKRNEQKDIVYNNYKFASISEAYDVLSNSSYKSIYDKYGYDALIYGLTDNDNNLIGGYKFKGNSYEIFEKFFGTSNPHTILSDTDKNNDEIPTILGSSHGGLYSDDNYDPPLDLKTDVNCKLEDIYSGGLVDVFYSKITIKEDGRTTHIKDFSRSIYLTKGIHEDEKLIFKGEGNEKPGYLNSDLIITIKQIPHNKYKRNKSDLLYTYNINLADTFKCKNIEILTLDGRKQSIFIDEIITPKSFKTIEGEGLPVYTNPSNYTTDFKYAEALEQNENRKGNLFIKFNILFPKYISLENKEEISNILENCKYC